MFYESELRFLCDTFRKNHVKTTIVTPNDSLSSVLDTDLITVLGLSEIENSSVHRLVGALSPKTLYKYTDSFDLCYIYLSLPAPAKASILFIGPYLSSQVSNSRIPEICEKNNISPQIMHYLKEHYSTIPILSETDRLFVMLSTFCELIWSSPSFSIVDSGKENQLPVSPINSLSHNDNFDELLINMKAMETRYQFENELIQAVTLGQIHKESVLFASISEQAFEKRLTDPLRNAKNYCIIMNTLLRKAAENGGVHPVYIDRVSSEIASKIEQLSSLSENTELMRDIFRTYCRLVRKHALKAFSQVVQKTVLIIDSDLSADLSLSTLAENQNISPGYLSTIFKKETGKTVSEYIREKRVKHAAHLLSTTHLQIQTVALHCGIMDVQYFSKIFKKHTGMTPREYRDAKNTKSSIKI